MSRVIFGGSSNTSDNTSDHPPGVSLLCEHTYAVQPLWPVSTNYKSAGQLVRYATVAATLDVCNPERRILRGKERRANRA